MYKIWALFATLWNISFLYRWFICSWVPSKSHHTILPYLLIFFKPSRYRATYLIICIKFWTILHLWTTLTYVTHWQAKQRSECYIFWGNKNEEEGQFKKYCNWSMREWEGKGKRIKPITKSAAITFTGIEKNIHNWLKGKYEWVKKKIE